MVFSSVPLYLDPPNWPNQHGDGVDGSESSALLQPAMEPQLQPQPPAAAGGGAIRAGSMTDRARLAKIPLPEAALKCPRCESTNTKFCYFNNYSLSQPRHFCKTCRRYWTRGGALRNVPVGGGCRRNKRSGKGSRSKSPGRAEQQQNGGAANSSGSNNSMARAAAAHHLQPAPQPAQQLPFLPPLQNLSGFAAPDLGLNFNGTEMEFPNNLSARFADLFRLQQGFTQLPFLSGLDNNPTGGLYQFEAGLDQYVGGGATDHLGAKPFEADGGEANMVNVKMEGHNSNNNNNFLNLSRNFLGMSGNNDQFWTGNNGFATDLSGYASSTSRLL